MSHPSFYSQPPSPLSPAVGRVLSLLLSAPPPPHTRSTPLSLRACIPTYTALYVRELDHHRHTTCDCPGSIFLLFLFASSFSSSSAGASRRSIRLVSAFIFHASPFSRDRATVVNAATLAALGCHHQTEVLAETKKRPFSSQSCGIKRNLSLSSILHTAIIHLLNSVSLDLIIIHPGSLEQNMKHDLHRAINFSGSSSHTARQEL